VGRLGAPGAPRTIREAEQLACMVETNQGLRISALLEAGVPVYPVNPRAGLAARLRSQR